MLLLASLSAAPFKSFSFKDFHSTGSTKARRYPLSYTFSGFYYWGGYLRYQGTAGYWWAASSNESSGAYDLSMDSSSLNPSTNNHDNNLMYGLSLRFFHSSTGSTKARRYPLSYIYSGYYRSDIGDLSGDGKYGVWWTILPNNNSDAYHLTVGFDISYVVPRNSSPKVRSLSLRYIIQKF